MLFSIKPRPRSAELKAVRVVHFLCATDTEAAYLPPFLRTCSLGARLVFVRSFSRLLPGSRRPASGSNHIAELASRCVVSLPGCTAKQSRRPTRRVGVPLPAVLPRFLFIPRADRGKDAAQLILQGPVGHIEQLPSIAPPGLVCGLARSSLPLACGRRLICLVRCRNGAQCL